MTFGNILADAYRRLRYQASPATDVVTRLTAFANDQHRMLLSLPEIMQLRDATLPFASTANAATSVLPQAVARIKGIHERTNHRVLTEISLDELRKRDPGLTAIGTPWAFARGGYVEVAVQPSAATELFVDSTAAGDTGTVYVEGIRTGGYPIAFSTTMTGTTEKSIGAAYTDIILVTKFYISAAAVGAVTLWQGTAGAPPTLTTELARIPIGQTFARYQQIHWHPVPATSLTYYADVTRTIPDLANANDEPLLPPDFHDLIGLGIRRREYEFHDDAQRLLVVAAEEKERVAALRYFVQSTGTGLLSLRGATRQRRWSMLGPNYPAGS